MGPFGDVAEDRGIGQGMAVDLAGHARGDLPAGGLRVSPLEVGVVLTEMQGPGERDPRVGARRQAREPVKQEVDLQLGADRLRRRVALLAEKARQGPGGDVRQDEARAQRPGLAVVDHVDLGVILAARGWR